MMRLKSSAPRATTPNQVMSKAKGHFKVISLRPPSKLKRPERVPRMIKRPTRAPTQKCSGDEKWDKIESVCVPHGRTPQGARKSPVLKREILVQPTIGKKGAPEPEEITEDGFSSSALVVTRTAPIPGSDDKTSSSPVARGSGRPSKYDYPVVKPPNLDFGLPSTQSSDFSEPFYKNPVVIVGGVAGVALVAWLVFRK